MPLDITGNSQTTSQATILDLRKLADADASLPSAMRADLRWALNRIAAQAGSLARRLPATYAGVADLLQALRRDPQGLSAASISNIGRLLRRAIDRLSPVDAMAGSITSPAVTIAAKSDLPPGPAEALLTVVPDRFARIVLRPFMRWLDATGIAPGAITGDVLARYAANGAPQRLRHPRQHCRNVRDAWNCAVNADLPGWPQIAIDPLPDLRVRRSVRPADLDPALLSAIDRHLAARVEAHEGPRRARGHQVPPLKPSSAAKARAGLLLYAGALQDAGIDVAAIRSLSEFLDPDLVARALDILAERSNRQTGTQAANVAATVSALARHTAALPPEDLAELQSFAAQLRPRYEGMVAGKVKTLLLLRDPAKRRALLELPYVIARRGVREGGKRGARLVETALAIELLLVSCLRVSNVASLHLGQSFAGAPPGTRGGRGRHFLLVPSRLVKNSEPCRLELPPETSELLREFTLHHRPILLQDAEADGGFLFPGRGRAGSAEVGNLRQRIKRAIQDALGITMTPHQFRSFAASLYLERCPGDFVTLMHVLGHRRLDTLLKHYAFIDQEAAASAVQRFVLEGRKIQAPLRPGRNRRREASADRARGSAERRVAS